MALDGEAVTFGGIEEGNLDELRKLNDVTFPVRYNDKFYAEVLATRPEFTKYAYWNGSVVGAICCRIEDPPAASAQEEGGDGSGDGGGRKKRLYIMTLGVLARYRGRGIGSKLLGSVLDAARSPPHAGLLEEVYLHVQTSNEDARTFYARFGFQTVDIIRNYYRRIDPPDCYVLALALGEGQEEEKQQQGEPSVPAAAAAASACVRGALPAASLV